MLERKRILAGKKFETVTVTSNRSTTLTIWNTSKTGTSLTVQVPYGTTYTVSGGNITNYSKTGGGTYTASLPTRSISITYSILLEKVTVTSNYVCNIFIGDNSSYGVTSTTAYIPYGTTYNVWVSSRSGYITPATQTFTAGQNSRSITMNYTEKPTGIYVTNANSYNAYLRVICKDPDYDFEFTISARAENYFCNMRNYIGSILYTLNSGGSSITLDGYTRTINDNYNMIHPEVRIERGDIWYVTIS